LVDAARPQGQRLESALGVLKGRAVLEKARADLLKAYEFNPTLADVPGMLADLAFWDGRESDAYAWRGEQAAVRKEWETALAQYEIARETAKQPVARIEEGILESLIRLNRWDEARDLASDLESAGFLTSRYYRLVAEIHRHEGDLDAEEAALRKALELNPKDLEAVYALDSLLLRTNRLQEAYDLYDQTTDVVTNNGRLWHRQAKLATQLDRPRDAIEFYKRGLEVQPNSFILHYELAQVYLSLGEEYKARPHLNRAMELNPGFFVDQKKKEGD
jgi:tetratricopeptide (TPR) repeat protein